jgi:hypothetical protein
MTKQQKRLSAITILVVLSAVSCGAASWQAPPSWTVRSDGHMRASQRTEDFTTVEFIQKIKREEGKEFGYVLTPAGEAEIAKELRFRAAEITRLKNELANCR